MATKYSLQTSKGLIFKEGSQNELSRWYKDNIESLIKKGFTYLFKVNSLSGAKYKVELLVVNEKIRKEFYF